MAESRQRPSFDMQLYNVVPSKYGLGNIRKGNIYLLKKDNKNLAHGNENSEQETTRDSIDPIDIKKRSNVDGSMD